MGDIPFKMSNFVKLVFHKQMKTPGVDMNYNH